MASAEAICDSLNLAVKKRDGTLLVKAYDSLTKLPSGSSQAGLAALVVCAETAVQVRHRHGKKDAYNINRYGQPQHGSPGRARNTAPQC